MLDNQGHWDEISDQCKTCVHIHVQSLFMSGTATYCCGRYPKQKGENCPKYEHSLPSDDKRLLSSH